MEEGEPVLVSGFTGSTAGLFKEPRANRKLNQYVPRMVKSSVNYIAFAPVDRLNFDPDALIITANVTQARTILRSKGYTSGESWYSQGTPVLACAWMYVSIQWLPEKSIILLQV